GPVFMPWPRQDHPTGNPRSTRTFHDRLRYGFLEFCADCSERESLYDQEPEWDRQYEDQADTGPNPHVRLTAMVNDLVKATGTTYREVNARLNRRVGVISRVGADEQVIRRAVSAARAWLDQLDSST
ncbi:hypothetical protein AB0M27_45710, partial [Streptomyces sp. NPDC052107]